MKKLIIANWKMSPQTLKEAKEIFNGIKKIAGKLKKVETVICPPFVYLSALNQSSLIVKFGAQDVFSEPKGSYTGEISVGMLKDLGVKYVIIGHSSKREGGEINETINKKIKIAFKAGLKVVLCVGEKERDSDGQYLHFIKDQIITGLKGASRKSLKDLVIAYEPIWAISSSPGARADNSESAFRISILIRRILLPIAGSKFARSVPLLYGGSANSKNADGFLKDAGMQGLLVGKASLTAKDFNEILKIANK